MSRWLGLLAVLLAGGAAGCSGHACTAVGCLDGLVISFKGLKTSASYDIVINQITTTPEVVGLMTCLVAATNANYQQLACTSGEEHKETGAGQVEILDDTIHAIQITVSSGGAQIAQQTFDVNYTSRELNGPGCGVCTSAQVDMMVP